MVKRSPGSHDEGGAYLQECDSTRHGRKKYQQEEKGCENGSALQRIKYFWKCDKDQAGTGGRLQSAGKYSRKNGDSRENRDYGIQGRDVDAAFRNADISVQIASVGDSDSHTEA